MVTKQNNYEIMYIVDDEKPELAVALKKEFVEILTEGDSNNKVKKEEDFVRQFAYEINHKTKGHYFILEVFTTTKNVANFNRVFLIKQKQGDVIRKLVINLDQEQINTFKERKTNPEELKPLNFNSETRERRNNYDNNFRGEKTSNTKVYHVRNRKETKPETSQPTVKEQEKNSESK